MSVVQLGNDNRALIFDCQDARHPLPSCWTIYCLVTLFAMLTFVLPAAAALAIELAYPAPSSLHHLDHLRRANDLTAAQRNALFIKHLAATPQFAAAAQRVDKVSYATKMMFVQRDIKRQIRPRQALAANQQAAARRAARVLRWMSPPLVFDELMQRAAGTDAARHQRFLIRADDYTETLRRFFGPRALAEAARPGSACPGCAARMNFVEHQRIPRFIAEEPLAGVASAMVPATGYLFLLALALLLFAARRRNAGLA